MRIACACDAAFLPHTATMLCSLLENNSKGMQVYCLHSGLKHGETDTLERFVRNKGSTLHAFGVESSMLGSLKVDKHASMANYYRLLLPELLPPDVHRVLYLDSDMIIRKDLSLLWNVAMDDYPLAAVENPGSGHARRLGLCTGSKYFNSGVMLINLAEWRAQQIHRQAIDFIRQFPARIEFWDQDGLNVALADRWLELPLHWNAQHSLFFNPHHVVRYADMISDPSIVHFSGDGLKPWQFGVSHPFKEEYEKYRRLTPWSKYKPEGKPGLIPSARSKVSGGIKRGLASLARKDWFWKLAQGAMGVPEYLLSERSGVIQRRLREAELESLREAIKQLVPDRVVIGGPFKGLRYAQLESIGSTLAPKLLGTYEAELHCIIERICAEGYSSIINVGCAEGYYAVGLALRNPQARVFAYDTDPVARDLCRRMAQLNGVSERLVVREQFALRTLREIGCDSRGLVVSDCEGAERHIFKGDVAAWSVLVNDFDILIEVHEFLDAGLSEYIYDLFIETHSIVVIPSVHDCLRPIRYRVNRLASEPIERQLRLLAENRPSQMEWFYMTRRKDVQFLLGEKPGAAKP